jgi:hypothetical protein
MDDLVAPRCAGADRPAQRHGALQRALIAQWQAGAALLFAGGLLLLTMAISAPALHGVFLVLIALLAVPFALAAVSARVGRYRLAACWCTVAILADMLPLCFVLTALTDHITSPLNLAAVVVLASLFTLPLLAANVALFDMATALWRHRRSLDAGSQHVLGANAAHGLPLKSHTGTSVQ